MSAPCDGFVPGRHGTCGVCEVPAAEHPLVRETARAPEPEEHPLDALRRLTPNMWAPGDAVIVPPHVLAYALSEIDRLTEALAAAVRERDDSAADAGIWRGRCDDVSRTAAPSPLVALASAIACGPMGQGLVITRTSMGSVSVDTAQTADNAVAVARRILEAK